MAVLSTQKLDGEGEEVCVLVKDKHGKLQSRVRFMIQLGAQPVTFNRSHVSKGGEVGELRKPVVVFLAQEKSSKELWEHALKNPKQMADKWLKTMLEPGAVGRI